MEAFADKAVVAIALGVIAFIAWYSLDVYLFFTKRDFENVNFEMASISRDDTSPYPLTVEFIAVVGYNVPLKEILRNRFPVWRVIFAGLQNKKKEKTVLDFGSHSKPILSKFRGRISVANTTAAFKHAAGFPVKKTNCQFGIVDDDSERGDKYRIFRVLIVREEDLKNFAEYASLPTRTPSNLEWVGKIKEEYDAKSKKVMRVKIFGA